MTRYFILATTLLLVAWLLQTCSVEVDTGLPNYPGGVITYDEQTSIFSGHVFSKYRKAPIDSARVTVIMYHYSDQLAVSDYARYEYGDTDTTGRFQLIYLTEGYLCEIHCYAPGYWYYKVDRGDECNRADSYLPFEQLMPDTIFMSPL